MSYAVEWMLRDSDVVFFNVKKMDNYINNDGDILYVSQKNILVQQVSCDDPPGEDEKVGGLAKSIEEIYGVRDRSDKGKPFEMGSISVFEFRKLKSPLNQLFLRYVDVNNNNRFGKDFDYTNDTTVIQYPFYIVNIRAQEKKSKSETDLQKHERLNAFIKGLDNILRNNTLTKDRRDNDILKQQGERGEGVYDIYFPYQIGCGLGGGDWTQYEKVINNFASVWKGKVFIVKLPKKKK